MAKKKRFQTKVSSAFLNIGRRWSQTVETAAAGQELAIPARQAIDMALEQIRTFIETDAGSRIEHDGTVSHITNAHEVLGIIEGFLDHLATSTNDVHLMSLTDLLAATQREFKDARLRLNGYIRLLCELRDNLPTEQEMHLAQLADRSLADLTETALASPYMRPLPDGTLAGEPGVHIESVLLAHAQAGLQELLATGALSEEIIMAKTLLERVRKFLHRRPGVNWSQLEDPAGSPMGLVNQIIVHWQAIRSHHTVG